jgi:hypothetical protein
MDKWPHQVNHTPTSETLEAVRDPEWQRIRLIMKGKPTSEKLEMLNAWRIVNFCEVMGLHRQTQLQIDNYINALKRGGQLNDDLTIKRE